MRVQLVVAFVVEAFHGRLFDCPVHPLDLAAPRENSPPDCFLILVAPRVLARLQEGVTSIQESYGKDHLHLTVIKAYLARLLGNARVVRYLMQNRPEFLNEFQAIAELNSTLPPEAA